jgi:FMN reductase
MQLVAISGSPSARSRSAWLLQLAQTRLESVVREAATVVLRHLPPQALLAADAQQPAVHAAVQVLARAVVVVVARPIYKAAYSGLLKAFLDLLPADALRGKTVLPLATDKYSFRVSRRPCSRRRRAIAVRWVSKCTRVAAPTPRLSA